MDLTGRTLVHYEITALIGRGGMGEVYRARDTKLDRDVAIKVVPKEMSGDPERAARFEREARTLATLNHPNIAQIYGIEEADGIRFLVMEFVDGEDLAQRLARGHLDIDEAIEIAIAMATGLEEAHRQGVVHRDLKPANVKITPEGQVKVLDFGLARAYAGEDVSESDPALSPTITQAMTQAGAILGSAAYMSPEQARGRRVDKRADLWAFGVVFFEMLTGRRMFQTDTTTDTLAAVLRADIDLDALPDHTPPHVRRVLRRCLERDLDRRQRDAGDVRLDLLEAASEGGVPTTNGAARRNARAWVALVVVAALFGGVVGVFLARSGNDGASGAPEGSWKAFTVSGPYFINPLSATIRGDGRQIIYSQRDAEALLMVLDLDGSPPRSIPGTEGGQSPSYAPDGEHIAYFTGRGLHRIHVSGSGKLRLSSRAAMISNARWAPNDTIYFSSARLDAPQSEGVLAIGSRGGDERVLTRPDSDAGEFRHFIVDLAAGGRYALVAAEGAQSGSNRLYRLELGSGELVPVPEAMGLAQWAASGHLLVADMRQDALTATPYSIEELRPVGPTVRLVEGIGMPDVAGFGFDVSDEGTLIHGRTRSTLNTDTERSLVLLTHDGETREFPIAPGPWAQPRVGPDETQLLLRRVSASDCDLWTFDRATGSSARVTFDGDDHDPLWLADGRLVYVERGGDELRLKLFERVPGPERIVLTSEAGVLRLTGASSDGSRLFLDVSAATPEASGIHLLDLDAALDGDGATAARTGLRPWLVRETIDTQATPSPDGRWVAHTSERGGEPNVFLRRFDDPNTVLQVSDGGGDLPRWSVDGRTLYYVQAGQVLARDLIGDDEAIRLAPARLMVDADEEGYESVMYTPVDEGLLLLRREDDERTEQTLTVLVGLEARVTTGPGPARP